MTTKDELLQLLEAKQAAAKQELLDKLEAICRLPGGDLDGPADPMLAPEYRPSMFRELSLLYKRMPAYEELGSMVHGLWVDPPEPARETEPPPTLPATGDGLDPKTVAEFFGSGEQVHP